MANGLSSVWNLLIGRNVHQRKTWAAFLTRANISVGLLYAIFAFIATPVVGIYAFTIYNQYRIVEDLNSYSIHQYETIRQIHLISQDLVEMENGVRGYAITQDELYLKHYATSQGRIRDELLVLKNTTYYDDNSFSQINIWMDEVEDLQKLLNSQIAAIHNDRSNIVSRTDLLNERIHSERLRELVDKNVSDRLTDLSKHVKFVEYQKSNFTIYLISGAFLLSFILFSGAIIVVRLDAETKALASQQERFNEIERLNREQVVKSKERLLDSVGHEIRSPIQSLLAIIPKEHKGFRYIERIRLAVMHLMGATGPLEGLASMPLEPTDTDLTAFLRELVENAQYADVTNIAFEAPSRRVIAHLDAGALEDAITHILMNAVRHRTPGSQITVSLNADKRWVTIDIDNSGPNIPPDHLKSIFEYGVTTQEAGGGNLGQGLFATKNYVTRMRGQIEALNLPAGVRFRMTFPI